MPGVDNISIGSGTGLDGISTSNAGGSDKLNSSVVGSQVSLKAVHGTLITANGTVDDTEPVNIEVVNTTFFSDSGGTAKIISSGGEQIITYAGKDADSLIDCSIASGSFDFYIDDKLEIIS